MGLGNIESAVNLLKWLLISLMFLKIINSERRHNITRALTYKMKANVSYTEVFGIFPHSRKRTSAPLAMQTATGRDYKARRVREMLLFSTTLNYLLEKSVSRTPRVSTAVSQILDTLCYCVSGVASPAAVAGSARDSAGASLVPLSSAAQLILSQWP